MGDEFVQAFKKDMIALWSSDPAMKIEDLIEHIVHTLFCDVDLDL